MRDRNFDFMHCHCNPDSRQSTADIGQSYSIKAPVFELRAEIKNYARADFAASCPPAAIACLCRTKLLIAQALPGEVPASGPGDSARRALRL